jgi:hypothetical protein
VIVDGKMIGKVADGQTQSLDIEPGEHVIRLWADWGRSPQIPFMAHEAEEVRFKCISSLTGGRIWLAIAYATVLSHRYIKLERVSEAVASAASPE